MASGSEVVLEDKESISAASPQSSPGIDTSSGLKGLELLSRLVSAAASVGLWDARPSVLQVVDDRTSRAPTKRC